MPPLFRWTLLVEGVHRRAPQTERGEIICLEIGICEAQKSNDAETDQTITRFCNSENASPYLKYDDAEKVTHETNGVQRLAVSKSAKSDEDFAPTLKTTNDLPWRQG